MKTKDLLTLHCKDCKQNLPRDNFAECYQDNTPHEGYRCRECESSRHASWYFRNKEHAKEYMRKYRAEVKAQAFLAYGGYVCNCCSETERLFLDIDHVNNDGASHRREHRLNTGTQFYVWLRDNNYPPGFQVLCCNCNRGKFRNGGTCPHKSKGDTKLGHNFESSRPEHSIQHMRIPGSHATADQKLDKKGRSPMVGQLPSEASLANPELEPMVSGSGHGDSEYTGSGF